MGCAVLSRSIYTCYLLFGQLLYGLKNSIMPIFTVRKVMFSQASVILSTGGSGRHPQGRPPSGQTPPPGQTPPRQTPPGDAPWADTPRRRPLQWTHPTGMRSSLRLHGLQSSLNSLFLISHRCEWTFRWKLVSDFQWFCCTFCIWKHKLCSLLLSLLSEFFYVNFIWSLLCSER